MRDTIPLFSASLHPTGDGGSERSGNHQHSTTETPHAKRDDIPPRITSVRYTQTLAWSFDRGTTRVSTWELMTERQAGPRPDSLGLPSSVSGSYCPRIQISWT